MATPKSSTFHQILLNDLSVRIADIYNNDELEEDLKHDIVCRLISKLIGANSVSIILYKGKKDKLLCAGRYIDPIFAQATSVGQKKSKEIVNVMRYIDILEFLTVMKIDDYNSWKNGEVLESIYIQYQNFKFSNPIILNFEEFCSFMEEYKIKSKRKYIDFCYEVYKNHIREDVHYVSLDDPITGCYYYGLTHKNESSSLKNILSLYHSIHVSTGNIILTHLNEFPNNKLCSDNLLSKLKVSISTNALYLGVPLLVNNRPIGILRVLLREFLKFPIPATDNKRTMLLKEQKQERYNFKNNLDAIKYLKEIVNIESLALMLSMLIENLYFINGLRDISLKDALKGDINNLYEIADELTKVVNCYGCIIRLTDQNGNNAAIKGYSEEVKDYIDALNEIGDPYIEKSGALLNVIAKLFYKAGGEDTESADDLRTKVECLKTDFDAEGNPFFSYLYLDNKYRLVSSSNWTNILNRNARKTLYIAFSKMREIAKRFDIKSIIQIPIKEQKYGIVTFANTSNRVFLNKDVEMLIPVVKRLGIALKYDSAIVKAEMASKIEIQNSQRVIYHQLLSPLGVMRNNYNNLKILFERKQYLDLPNRLEEVTMTLTNTIDFVRINQYLATFLIEKKIKPELTNLDLVTFLIEKARTYQVYAKDHRDITIHVNTSNSDYIPTIRTDRNLLTHVMQALIDNAIKYSYSHKIDLFTDRNNPLFAPANKPKKITIDVGYEKEKFFISIENWGCKISEKEQLSIYDYMKRGGNAQKYEHNGTGIGLFIVHEITKALSGEVILYCKDDHTKFILNFKSL